MGFRIESSAFGDGGTIPRRYTGDGDNVSPPIRWSDVPTGTRELVLVLEDDDARDDEGGGDRPFVHWIVYGIPPQLHDLPEGIGHTLSPDRLHQEVVHGTNSQGNVGYDGPSPPPGAPHHYHLRLYALDRHLDIEPGADRDRLDDDLAHHVIARAELTGTYRRPRR